MVHYSVDCKMLILSGCYLSDLPLLFESKVFFSLSDIPWLSRFFEPERNFLNHLVTVLSSTAPSLFAQQIFLVAFAALRPRKAKVSQFDYVARFICATFKSHTKWINAQCVCEPPTAILPTTARVSHDRGSSGRCKYPTTSWTASATWYTSSKLARTKLFTDSSA